MRRVVTRLGLAVDVDHGGYDEQRHQDQEGKTAENIRRDHPLRCYFFSRTHTHNGTLHVVVGALYWAEPNLVIRVRDRRRSRHKSW